ncbi:MAG TPA: hypothetical protein VGG89_01355 [Candidatus Baltobacteraceae bacterium]|jgi:hypothetical protein
MDPSLARPPRPRAELEAQPASNDVVVELLCDIRDLLGECVVRLSELEAHAAERDR